MMRIQSFSLALRRRAACQRGGTVMMEFALIVFFLLIPMMAGFFELGRAFYHHQIMNEGLRAAGRYLSRVPTYTASCQLANPPANSPERLAANIALYGKPNITNADKPLLAYWNSYTQICIKAPRAETRTVTSGGTDYTINVDVIEISASARYKGLGVNDLAGLGNIDITASHEERQIQE